ncbi:MAG: V-type ATP synthase subunit E [Dehalococcoidia bacterium]|nr:V-type proton ATPase subunit E [Chloroflexota bacterium]MBT9162337.1 V-type proton ATPase subunit E [Chloroflexota bacterium]
MIAGMEKINEAILSKVREEARGIIAEAEEKAREEVEKARVQLEARLEEERRKMRSKAEVEAARILAQASIRARQELLKAKAEVIAEVTRGVKDALSRTTSNEAALKTLLREATQALETDRLQIYIAPRDKDIVETIVSGDGELSSMVMGIREADLLGGVMVEDAEGKMRIDNSYEARLESLLPRILPQVSKELFDKELTL